MQVFKTFFKIAKKQLPACMIYMVIFGLICMIFSSMGNSTTKEYENTRYNIAVFDHDNSKESAYLIKYLETVQNIDKSVKEDKEEIQDQMFYRKISYCLTIEEGYSLSGAVKSSKVEGTTAAMYIDSQIDQYQNTMSAFVAAGFNLDEAYSKTMDALNTENLVSLEGKTTDKPISYNFFIFLPYIFMSIMFVTLAPVIIAFNKREVNDRFRVSPMKPRKKDTQLIAASGLFSIAIWGFFMLAGVVFFGNEMISRSGILAMLNALVFTLVTVGIISIACCFSLKEDGLNMIANIVGLGLSFLGGVFVPVEYLGEGVRNISKFLPTYWYVNALNMTYDDKAAADIMKSMGVEIIFVIAFLAIALAVSKQRKLKRVQ